MKRKIRNEHLVELVFSLTAMVLAIVNLFLLNNCLRALVWSLIIVAFGLNIIGLLKRCEALFDENTILLYEISELQYSYKQMGRYIDNFEHADLFDIELRIINELNDIEIRKKHYAESLGIKEKDL